jgi:hypothetical protein
MANARVVAGSNRLRHAVKVLQDQWQLTEPTWGDAVRTRFEDRYIRPVTPAADAAVNGMMKLAEALDQIRRDCSDRSETQ